MVRRIALRSRVLRTSMAVALALSTAGAQRLAAPVPVAAGICGVNDAQAHPDPDTASASAYTTLEDTTLQVPAPGVLANDECVGDVDDINRSNESGGTFVLFDSGALTYNPVADGYGEAHVDYYFDSLDYGLSNTVRVTMTVIPVNDAPILYQTETGCGAIIIPEDSPAQSTSPCGWFALPGGKYEDAQTFTPHTSTDRPELFSEGPTLTLNSGTTPGYVTFTPKANANGFATIEVWVTDNGGTANGGDNKSNKHAAFVTLQPVADPPVAKTDSYSTPFNAALVVSAGKGVLDNDTDVDGDGLTASVVSQPSHGVLSMQPSGAFTYTPGAGYSGPDTFTYKATSGSLSDNGTATITVAAPRPSATAGAKPTAGSSSKPPGASTPPGSSAAPGPSPLDSVGSSPAVGASAGASAGASGPVAPTSTGPAGSLGVSPGVGVGSAPPGLSGSGAPGSSAGAPVAAGALVSEGTALLVLVAVLGVALGVGAYLLIRRRRAIQAPPQG